MERQVQVVRRVVWARVLLIYEIKTSCIYIRGEFIVQIKIYTSRDVNIYHKQQATPPLSIF
jgi:hypothetical protein